MSNTRANKRASERASQPLGAPRIRSHVSVVKRLRAGQAEPGRRDALFSYPSRQRIVISSGVNSGRASVRLTSVRAALVGCCWRKSRSRANRETFVTRRKREKRDPRDRRSKDKDRQQQRLLKKDMSRSDGSDREEANRRGARRGIPRVSGPQGRKEEGIERRGRRVKWLRKGGQKENRVYGWFNRVSRDGWRWIDNTLSSSSSSSSSASSFSSSFYFTRSDYLPDTKPRARVFVAFWKPW